METRLRSEELAPGRSQWDCRHVALAGLRIPILAERQQYTGAPDALMRVVESGNARSEDGELNEVAAVERQRIDRFLPDHLADRRILGLQQRDCARDFDGLFDVADLHGDVEPGALPHLQNEIAEHHRTESGPRRAGAVAPWNQFDGRVGAGAVARNAYARVSGFVGDGDFDARHGGAGLVCDVADEGSAFYLRVEDRRDGQSETQHGESGHDRVPPFEQIVIPRTSQRLLGPLHDCRGSELTATPGSHPRGTPAGKGACPGTDIS